MKLSFIVPIYGVEQYLRKCVESLLHQDYNNYEIILVDDGSKDGCPTICDEYAAKCDFIKVVHRANGGLSAARNSGIEVTKGEYICFVDSDDYWAENVLGDLMEQVERENLDVLRFDYKNVIESGAEVHLNKDPKVGANYDDNITNGYDFLNNRLGCGCYVWQFICRSSIVKKEYFTEGIYLEDVDWTPRMLARANRVSSTQRVVYNYLWREGSITQSVNVDKKRKMLTDQLYIIGKLAEWKEVEQMKDWAQRGISGIVINFLHSISIFFYADRKNWIDQLQDINWKPLKTQHHSVKYKLKIFLVEYIPELYVKIIKIL